MAKNVNAGDYGAQSEKTKLLVSRIVTYIFLAIVTFLSLFSFYLMIINSTRSMSPTSPPTSVNTCAV